MAFVPQTYIEALERARSRPIKPRKPLARARMAVGHEIPEKPRRSLSRTLKSRPTRVAKKKKTKKLSVGNLKKKVWTQFSIFIRTRGADSDGWNSCVTCGERSYWKALQAGHFVRGRLNANLFDERGVNPQCVQCNIYKQGHVIVYYRWMEKNYGADVINELLLQNSRTHKWAAGELQSLLNHYKSLNAANPLTEGQPQ